MPLLLSSTISCHVRRRLQQQQQRPRQLSVMGSGRHLVSIFKNCSSDLDRSRNSRQQHPNNQRMMSSSKKQDNSQKQAMQRQRQQQQQNEKASTTESTTAAAATSTTPDTATLSTTSSSSSSSSWSESRNLALSRPPLSASFLTPQQQQHHHHHHGGGLARLDLRSNLNRHSFVSDRADLVWESNKATNGGILLNTTTNNNNNIIRNSLVGNDDQNDIFQIDREAMFDPTIHLPHAPQDWKGYEAATPLSDFLMQRIGVSGQPITTAEYMRHALTHPLYGYYTSRKGRRRRGQPLSSNASAAQVEGDDDDDWDNDEYDESSAPDKTTTINDASSSDHSIFGRAGDFVTAPELSSVFGHSLCVWFMTVWQQAPLHRPPAIQFVELGPGQGTLMADLLELAHSSKLINFGRTIQSVHLVEASHELRKEQKKTLQKALGHLIRLEFADDDDDKKDNVNQHVEDVSSTESTSFVNTIRVEWYDSFTSFQHNRDKDVPTMMVLQEFLDALPVHQFQKTKDGWRERMIDVMSVEDSERIENLPKKPSSSDGKERLIPRLRQVLAPQVTPAVEVLLMPNQVQYEHFPEGTVVEICPDAHFLLQDIARVLEESQGAALIIDYGEEGTADSLRAFSRHQQVPLTSRPGLVDVTADVDFFALKNCLSGTVLRGSGCDNENTNAPKELEIHAFGPVPQGEFLMRMGAGELTMNTIEKPETSEEKAQAMADALKYLVMPEHMGEKFKVLALARKRDGLFGPAGMEPFSKHR